MAAGTVADNAVEAVAEVAETVSEESGQFADATRLLSSRDVGLTLSGLGVGVAIGFVGGWFVLKNRLQTKYERWADEEVAGMRVHYDQKLTALEQREEKGQLKETLENKIEGLEYKTPADPRVPEGPVPYHRIGKEDPDPSEESKPEEPVVEQAQNTSRNVFEEQEQIESDNVINLNPDWDYEKELKNRNPSIPYVIHQDEYREAPEGDKNYEKVTLTYYEGDDVLADERDQVIEKKDEVISVANLSKFGHGSGDPNIVYIRNNQLEADIELVRSEGKYATEVHGFQDSDLQHSSMRRRTPRRSDFDDMER